MKKFESEDRIMLNIFYSIQNLTELDKYINNDSTTIMFEVYTQKIGRLNPMEFFNIQSMNIEDIQAIKKYISKKIQKNLKMLSKKKDKYNV